jgi:hypothetical protein
MTQIINPPPPPKITVGAEFSERNLLEFFYRNAVEVLWESAAECACRSAASPYSDAARADCPVCHGTRWDYHSPVNTWAIVTGLETNPKLLRSLGSWAYGRAMITMRQEQLPASYDRITLLHSTHRVRAMVQRTASGAVDALRHPVVPQNLEVAPDVFADVGVRHLRLTNADGTAGPERVQGTHFTITPGGDIDWTLGIALGAAPTPGQRYTADYLTRARYLIESLPHTQRLKMKHDKLPDWQLQRIPVECIGRLDTVAELTEA